jgi:two-component system, sensor histidine kinase
VEFRVRDPEVGARWLMGIGQATYAEDGRPLRVTGLNIDISDLKRAEKELRHAEQEARAAWEEAERANRAKSGFLAAASHDLRQPVQALVLLNCALAEKLEGRAGADIVANMGESLDSLQRLINTLLDVTRLDAGTVVPRVEAVSLGGVLARLAEEYSLRAAQKGLAFRAVGTGAWTRTDLTLLERVVRNLIENALRYTARGKILVGCRRRGNIVRVCVADTGIGIPPEHRQAIFQEFYRVGGADTGEKGFGLGLSIVKRLCALLDHPVSLASEAGKGSCFMVDLPLASPEGSHHGDHGGLVSPSSRR